MQHQNQNQRTMRTSLKVIWLMCLLALATGGCLNGSKSPDGANSKEPVAEEGPPQQVVVAEAQSIVWPRTVHVQGDLLSDERVVVGAKVAGRIASLGEDTRHQQVDLGSEVAAGDVLARLETEELELKVQQAESQLEQVRATLGLVKDQDDSQLDPAKVPSVVQEKALWDAAQDNWNRAKALERETAISGEEVQQRKSAMDVAAARYESALHSVNESIALLGVRRAELGLARQALQDAEIRAPFAGVIEQRFIAPGAYVQVGQPVVALVKVDPWRFRASVPEREAAAVRVGQRVTIDIEGERAALEAVIARISPSVEMSNRALTIEAVQAPAAESANPAQSGTSRPQLRRGLFAEADIDVDPEARTLAVPRAAVREFAGVEKVWRVVDGAVAEQRVEMGRQNDAFAEILSGLAAGDVVVVEDFPRQAGPVEVAKKQ
jgi:RND family efflux transporter MFP subunit